MAKVYRILMMVGLIIMAIFDIVYFVNGTMAQVALLGMFLFIIGAFGNRKMEKTASK